ncbi:hypothetical protein Poli38472_005535 [Pythium oligandrum]|uniref:histone acetyltransferase n=1 Tax=Pythium oligandrum TaxID=41045 RepID=A0A8K1CGG7_PYTOL|nr:hypothetical protein Poli38472_005535 [Pythium oligandrum]|eukprot:TMW62917.1 hypothetical protein Poli38472_005535 [Pythium oligandrum]
MAETDGDVAMTAPVEATEVEMTTAPAPAQEETTEMVDVPSSEANREETTTNDAVKDIENVEDETAKHGDVAVSTEEEAKEVEATVQAVENDQQSSEDVDMEATTAPESAPTNGETATPQSEVKTESEDGAALKRKEPSEASTKEVADVSNAADASAVARQPAKKQKVDETPASTGPVLASAPIMISRDDMAKMEEDGGMLKFDVITNDGTPERMIQLTTLKNIFARQLPKMPREYIVRLVFDRNHRSMVILKNGKHVIGGICYRPFEPNHFAEIAFCAINAADQVKGYGTRLMNHLKEYVKSTGITHFLTYADNYAIGYFKKQGFAKVVSMPKSNWFGYIKDYDGGTLMECTIHHQINYLRITSMVQQQRKKIQDKIKERSHADIVYPGITQFAEGRTMDIYMIPGVKEAGWSQAVIRNSRVGTRDPGSLRTQLQQLWKAMSSHRSAWPFHEPVDTAVVVDYLDYIKEPVDLSLIQKRIESGHYLSKAEFKNDLDKMCANCMVYNTPDTNYYKAAKDLQDFIDRRVQLTK